MEHREKEFCLHQNREDALEAKIDAAKEWISEPTNDAKRMKFNHMAKLIAQRSPECIRELEFQKFGFYI